MRLQYAATFFVAATAVYFTIATETIVNAQNLEPIKARQTLLKGMGDGSKAAGAMLKGEAEFDLPKVQDALKKFQDGAAKLPDLFPEDSKTGGETEALPAIWDNKQDFSERFPKLAADAKAAEAAITDEFSFQETWPKLVNNCKDCHKTYRQKK